MENIDIFIFCSDEEIEQELLNYYDLQPFTTTNMVLGCNYSAPKYTYEGYNNYFHYQLECGKWDELPVGKCMKLNYIKYYLDQHKLPFKTIGKFYVIVLDNTRKGLQSIFNHK